MWVTKKKFKEYVGLLHKTLDLMIDSITKLNKGIEALSARLDAIENANKRTSSRNTRTRKK